jgi:hypothetical protein
MGIPFSKIFSIILIIAFIAVAFYVINAFIKSKECTQIRLFVSNLQDDIDRAWNSPSYDSLYPGVLPEKIQMACFVDFVKPFEGQYVGDVSSNIALYRQMKRCDNDYCNLLLYPREKACSVPGHKILHLDVENLTKDENPFCIKNYNGRVEFRIVKNLRDRLVTIKNVN